MKRMRIVVALSVVLAVSVGLTSYYIPEGVAPRPNPGASGPAQLYTWSQPNYEGPMAGGVPHAMVLRVPVLPNGTTSVYVDGTFGTISWILLTNGYFNRSGNCGNSFSPAGACDLYVGIWTPPAWASYASGGPGTPIWCFPGVSEGCLNVSSASFDTPNLSSLDGTGWEIVLWNVATYDLSGSFLFTVYSSSPPS